MSETTAPVAFFDFDGTLTTKDSLMPFLKYLEGGHSYYLKLAKVSPHIVLYLAGLLRNDIAKTLVFQRYLKGMRRSELFAAGSAFSKARLPELLRPEGMERLKWHQSQQHRCVLVSASLDVYLGDWASQHGLDDVLSTHLVYVDDVATGEIEGSNCFGLEKVRRIQRWMNGKKPAVTYAYGDSKGDLPMVQLADHGFLWNGRQFVALDK